MNDKIKTSDYGKRQPNVIVSKRISVEFFPFENSYLEKIFKPIDKD